MKNKQGDEVVMIRRDFNGDKYFCILKTPNGYRWSNNIIPKELIADYPSEIQRVLRSLEKYKRYPASMVPH